MVSRQPGTESILGSTISRKTPLDQETIQLILEMKKLNPTWGGQRISDELAKIGYKACRETVLKYLEIYGLHDPPEHHGLSWKEFMNNHSAPRGV